MKRTKLVDTIALGKIMYRTTISPIETWNYEGIVENAHDSFAYAVCVAYLVSVGHSPESASYVAGQNKGCVRERLRACLKELSDTGNRA